MEFARHATPKDWRTKAGAPCGGRLATTSHPNRFAGQGDGGPGAHNSHPIERGRRRGAIALRSKWRQRRDCSNSGEREPSVARVVYRRVRLGGRVVGNGAVRQTRPPRRTLRNAGHLHAAYPRFYAARWSSPSTIFTTAFNASIERRRRNFITGTATAIAMACLKCAAEEWVA